MNDQKPEQHSIAMEVFKIQVELEQTPVMSKASQRYLEARLQAVIPRQDPAGKHIIRPMKRKVRS